MPVTCPIRTLSATFALLSVVLLPGRRAPAAPAANPPRYELPVGRTLSYSREGKSQEAGAAPRAGSRMSLRATVVAANADGSRRVLLRRAYRSGDRPEEVAVGAFDVFPDGRTAVVGRFNPDISASPVFPLLPPDAASAAAKWVAPADWGGTVMTYSAAPARPAAAADEFVFTEVADGAVNRIFVVTSKSTLRFDRRKGVIVGSEDELSQGYGSNHTSTARLTLDKDDSIDPARAAALGAAYVKFFEADARYVEVLKGINEEPENAAKLSDAAKAVLTTAMKGVDEPEVVKEFEQKIKAHDENLAERLDAARKLAGRLNKPAADWEAKDLDGKAWSLAGLRGKVVVMDFWYRGCGWCMYAMPQVRQLAADYKDQPVVVLGMNTDGKEEDARFVVKELGLTYPQIKAEGLDKRFEVEGFPTLIIIDQAGVVRGVHLGYSADLRERVAKRIDALLQKKPA